MIKAFVDTNVLLRALMSQMALHQQAQSLIQRMWEQGAELWISRQVIREYLVQITHPNTFSPALTPAQIDSQVELIQLLFHVADETQVVTSHLLALIAGYSVKGKQIHDANIVATMLANEIDTLLTLNSADFRRFSSQINLVSV